MTSIDKLLIKLISLYQYLRSGLDAIVMSVFGFVSSCPQHPTCSEYMKIQIRKHGTIRGVFSGLYRIVTCW